MSEVHIKNFKRVLVANRGEIAIRVFRALNELGITSVAVYSKEDKYAMFRTLADEAYALNPEKGPVDAYLDIPTIIKIAKDHNVDAIHPGYGFLAENPILVEECAKNGIVFIGPTVESMNAMGDKISSKQIAIASDVPIIPGVDHAIKTTKEALEVAEKVGYPVMLKASNGGGGRGMRIVNKAEDMPKEFKEAIDESKKAFGDDQVFIEKYLRGPKHVEVRSWPITTATWCTCMTVTAPCSAATRRWSSTHPPSPCLRLPARRSSTAPSACASRSATATPVPASSWSTWTATPTSSK